MELWIFFTLAAAFLQNIRSALQKHLKARMSTVGATFVRFGFGLPITILYVLILVLVFEFELPNSNLIFLFWVIIGSLAQILATALLVYLFSLRNFTVGTAYSRTEAAQTAILAFILLGEGLPFSAIAAILISVIGVMAISVAKSNDSVELNLFSFITSLSKRTALIGIASGALFSLAAVGYREAILNLEHDFFIIKAAFTLLIGITFQTLVMLIWFALKNPSELKRIRLAWRPSLIVGFVGATATFGWFAAFALQQAAIVKALAQIEMIFTIASSIFIFKEKITPLEIIGCILILSGIFILVLN